jgi:hypothetical protein
LARFALDKWYLDVVDDRGRAVVGYASELRWGRVTLRHASALVSLPGGEQRTRTTVRKAALPSLSPAGVSWEVPALGLSSSHRPLCAPFASTLLCSAEGEVRWSCHAPRADAELTLDGERFRGRGYAEHLALRIAPWRLPIAELRWGRALAADRGVVWIDWRGREHSRRLVAVDGEHVEATVDDGGVTLDGVPLVRLGTRRTLRQGAIGATALASLPRAVRSRLPASLLAVDEQKWTGAASLQGAEASAIWEVVRWG